MMATRRATAEAVRRGLGQVAVVGRQQPQRRGQQGGATRKGGYLEEVRELHPIMFCYQCEQTAGGKGCDRIGMCGKRPQVAALQDLAVHVAKGISQYAHAARELDAGARDAEVDRYVLEVLFATMTNVNNDRRRFVEFVKEGLRLREKARGLYRGAGGQGELGGPAGTEVTDLTEGGLGELAEREAGVLARSGRVGDEDVFGMMELVTYGVKGMAAYAHHAMVQGVESEEVYAGVHELLAAVSREEGATVEGLLGAAMRAGEVNLKVMALLEEANVGRYGKPTPRTVRTRPVAGKCILVSGHDLQDLGDILEQTAGTGIKVYTHGELLPGHGYPELARHEHLVGHWGGAWQKQRVDFAEFPGAVVMTTNCMIEPKGSYKGRIFTRSVVGWPGVRHVAGRDYSEVIAKAKECEGFREGVGPLAGRGGEEKEVTMTTGFGADAILGAAEGIVGAVKSGALRHFYVIGGCDGRESARSYFTDLAQAVPQDSVVLTLGCGKFRFNTLDFGTVPGTDIPRLLDVGQCNDAYGAVRVALALKEAFGVASVNDLPISFGVSWFEQKAVAVLLTLLYLDIKNIHLGPQLPAFLTPNLVKFLVDTYGITPVGDGPTDALKMHSMKDNNLHRATAA